MENFSLYPTLTPDVVESSGISTEKYRFTYSYQGQYNELNQQGKTTVKLSDPLTVWKVEEDGLIIDKTIRIAYPDLLKGQKGVVCSGAEFGICIIWTNKKLSQTGVILPHSDVTTPKGRVCRFRHEFQAGEIAGDLDLSVSMYVKAAAERVLPGEENFINEVGVTIGEIEQITLNFNSQYMEFPIEEFRSAEQPLWWVEFSEWEDPKTIDMFTKDSLCLYLNPYYEGCPKLSIDSNENSIKNIDMMVDILSQTYLMIFQRLSEDDLRAAKHNIGLAENSICSILYQFIEGCYEELHWESPEELLKSLQVNIRKKLQEEA